MNRSQLNPKHIANFVLEGYSNLGWSNLWVNAWNPSKSKGVPEVVTRCREAKHKVRELNNSQDLYRGTDYITICDECKYFYHTDSSD